MDFPTILSAIGSVGFPIVACCAMAYFFSKVNNHYREDIKELSSQHKAEMDLMTQAINNNTLVLQRLTDTLGVPELIEKNKEV